MLPDNILRTISMVKVKIYNCGMGEPVVDDCVGNADMDIVDPAEPRWPI
jgi:hypothetical protein